MKPIGTTLLMVGLALYAFATFLFDPSVKSYGGGYAPDRIVNLDLQQRQLLVALLGLTLFLAGIIMHVAEAAIERMGGTRADAETIRAPLHAGAVTDPATPSVTDDELMHRYGIAREGEAYAYGEYRYSRLADAVAYAKLQESRPSPQVAAARMGIRPGDDGAQV